MNFSLLIDQFITEYDACRDKRDAIGQDQWKVINDGSIDEPDQDADADQKVHSQGNILCVPGFYSFDELGEKRYSSACRCDKSYDRIVVHKCPFFLDKKIDRINGMAVNNPV